MPLAIRTRPILIKTPLLIGVLIGLLLPHASTAICVGEIDMSTPPQNDEKTEKPPCGPAESDMVITPAGPVPKDKVHEVKPGEAVQRGKDGTLAVVPRKEPR